MNIQNLNQYQFRPPRSNAIASYRRISQPIQKTTPKNNNRILKLFFF